MSDVTTRLLAALSGTMVDQGSAEEGLWFEFPWTKDQFKLARYSSPRAARLREQKIATLQREATDEDRKRIDEEVFAEALVTDWKLAADPELACTSPLVLSMLREPRCFELVAWLRNQTFSERFKTQKPAAVSLGN